MNKPNLGTGVLVGVMTIAAAIAIFFAADVLLALPLLPFNIFDWVARALPGDLITFGVDTMVDTLILVGFDVSTAAKPAEQIMAVGMVAGLGVVATVVYFLVARSADRSPNTLAGGFSLGLLVGLPLLVAADSVANYSIGGAIWVLAVFVGWGLAVAAIYEGLAAPADEKTDETAVQTDRRRFLIRAGGASAAITVVGSGLAVALQGSREERLASAPTSEGFRAATIGGDPVTLPNMDATLEPAEGTRSEYTPLEEHYQIDINSRPPILDEEEWRLNITGMVRNPLELTLAQIVENYEAREEFVTLSCISNRIAGSLISTTLWTGVSLRDVLADAGVRNGAEWLFIESADGFFESVNLEMVMNDPRIMLTYAWDRRPLRTKHGFPLRIWIPDRYGMKQPKWIESIEVTDEYTEGYWVQRNWSEDAIVRTTSVIDTVGDPFEENGELLVPIGGIAYSGAKGISRVQVSIDDGEWQDADLRMPISDYTWVIWRYDWPFEEGQHRFAVRCYEGDGDLQITESNDVRPDGATGIHTVRRSVEEPTQA